MHPFGSREVIFSYKRTVIIVETGIILLENTGLPRGGGLRASYPR